MTSGEDPTGSPAGRTVFFEVEKEITRAGARAGQKYSTRALFHWVGSEHPRGAGTLCSTFWSQCSQVKSTIKIVLF